MAGDFSFHPIPVLLFLAEIVMDGAWIPFVWWLVVITIVLCFFSFSIAGKPYITRNKMNRIVCRVSFTATNNILQIKCSWYAKMFPILFQIFKTSPGGNVNDSVKTKLAHMEGIFEWSHGCLTPAACFYQENINLCTLCIDFVSSQCAQEGPFIKYHFAEFKTYKRMKRLLQRENNSKFG